MAIHGCKSIGSVNSIKQNLLSSLISRSWSDSRVHLPTVGLLDMKHVRTYWESTAKGELFTLPMFHINDGVYNCQASQIYVLQTIWLKTIHTFPTLLCDESGKIWDTVETAWKIKTGLVGCLRERIQRLKEMPPGNYNVKTPLPTCHVTMTTAQVLGPSRSCILYQRVVCEVIYTIITNLTLHRTRGVWSHIHHHHQFDFT